MEPFTDYEIFRNGPEDITYRTEWYQKNTLLINKKSPVNIDDVIFFGDRLKSELGDNTSFINTIDKKFYKFRVIQIKEDPKGVYEHFSFVHPYYGDDTFHRLFFSEDLEYMLERH
jgi:hypothetical protein